MVLNDRISCQMASAWLASFKPSIKIKLGAGESKRIKFVIDKEKLSFYNQSLQWVTEPGDFDLMIGASSEDIRLKGSFELKK